MPAPAPPAPARPTCTASAATPRPSDSAASPVRTSRCPQATDSPTRPAPRPCYHADEPSAPPWCTGWIWSFGPAHQGHFLPSAPPNCQVRSTRPEPCLRRTITTSGLSGCGAVGGTDLIIVGSGSLPRYGGSIGGE